MNRQLYRLSAAMVAKATNPGKFSDGGGLYLIVEKTGAKRWAFIFRWQGKLREMGLGSATPGRVQTIGLATARARAQAAREALEKGLNPIEVKRAEAAIPTFGEIADEFIEDMKPRWRNEKHHDQWTNTIAQYAAKLRPMRVDHITTNDVVAVLKPIWNEKSETASRVRGRIERILDAAKARGLIASPWENPARWRGHLDHLLPPKKRLTRGHHAAMPYEEIGAFMAALRLREGVTPRALEFLILTAARSGEVMGATWGEIDLKAKVWTVPADRMKAGREHRVPLSARAVEVLKAAAPLAAPEGATPPSDAHVFPGQGGQGPLSIMAFDMLLRRMKSSVTTHGFRSTFRDWAGEVSSFSREVAEAALAHTVGDATERAYRRGDALEKRRLLMEAWASYVDRPGPAKVLTFARQA